MVFDKIVIFSFVPFLVWGDFYHDKNYVSCFLKPCEITEKYSGLETVDCIYVINLDNRPERWERTKRFFNEQGFFPNRFSAVSGWELLYWKLAILTGPDLMRLNKGQTGVFLSHLSIYRDAYERGFNVVWICEDDVEFYESGQEIDRLINKLKKIDPEWDLFYTDNKVHGKGAQDPRLGQALYSVDTTVIDDDILKMKGRHGLHSAIFSRNGLKKILDYFEHVFFWSPIDVDIHYVPNINEYSVTKDVVSLLKEGTYSDTEDASSLNHYK